MIAAYIDMVGAKLERCWVECSGGARARVKVEGFTLVEMMVSVSIFAIALAIAIPNIKSYISTSRTSSVAGDLLVAVRAARSEAVVRGTKVSLCPADTTASSPTCLSTGTNDWSKYGWLMVDASNNSIRQWAKPTNVTVVLTPTTATQLSFTGATGTAGSDVNIAICPVGVTGTGVGRGIAIKASGRSVINVATC